MISEAVLDAEVKIGELMSKVPKATKGSGGNRYKTAAEKSREKLTDEHFSNGQCCPDVGPC